MKLRILDNAIRLRLSQTEVTGLRDSGAVRAAIQFPGLTALHYQVLHSSSVEEAQVGFTNSEITLMVPTPQVVAWADSDTVSIKAENALPDGKVLSILLEKDFKCLTTREHEDESDLFPHPKEGEVAC